MTALPSMTSRERVLAALNRKPVDRTPVCNPTSVATVELMDLVDANFPFANRDPELMARLAATSYTELGFDSIMPVSRSSRNRRRSAARCSGSRRTIGRPCACASRSGRTSTTSESPTTFSCTRTWLA